MAGQRQPDPALMLPDMGHLMDEKALRLQRAVAKILAPQAALGVEPDVPVGRHGDPPRLERPPSAMADADRRIIDRIAEDGGSEIAFRFGQGAGSHAKFPTIIILSLSLGRRSARGDHLRLRSEEHTSEL